MPLCRRLSNSCRKTAISSVIVTGGSDCAFLSDVCASALPPIKHGASSAHDSVTLENRFIIPLPSGRGAFWPTSIYNVSRDARKPRALRCVYPFSRLPVPVPVGCCPLAGPRKLSPVSRCRWRGLQQVARRGQQLDGNG